MREIGTSKAEEMIDESLEEHHAMFPLCEKRLGRARLEALGERMQRMGEGGQRRAA